MNKARIERYRAQLTAQLAELLANNDTTVGRLERTSEAPADPNDRASLESGRNFDLRLRDRDRKLILKIREALNRIEQGSFGICEDCGHEIEDRRLAARPVTSQCFECKEDQERRERRAGSPSPAPEAPAPAAPEPARRAPAARRARASSSRRSPATRRAPARRS